MVAGISNSEDVVKQVDAGTAVLGKTRAQYRLQRRLEEHVIAHPAELAFPAAALPFHQHRAINIDQTGRVGDLSGGLDLFRDAYALKYTHDLGIEMARPSEVVNTRLALHYGDAEALLCQERKMATSWASSPGCASARSRRT